LECSELISEVSKVPYTRKELTKVQYKFLILFATSDPLSVYQIYRSYESIHKMKYKQGVDKVVKRLLDLKLIETVENTISKHHAIDYRLSTMGLYYLFHSKSEESRGHFKKVLTHYHQNKIFTTLLYPYLQKSTVLNIADTSLISKICTYLNECCEEIQSALESIEKSYSKHVVQQVCLWNDIGERGVDNERLIQFLRREFGIIWLDSRAEIVKYGNNNTIRISKRNKRILITLNERRTEATMTMNKNELYKFTVSPMLEILFRGQTIRDWSRFFFLKRVEILASDLVMVLALRATIESDTKVLSQDEKFMQVLRESERKFYDRYRKFVEFVSSP
jgi:hypothetical protein